MNCEIDHALFIRQGSWPNWPILPVKNHSKAGKDGFPAMGLIVDNTSLDEEQDTLKPEVVMLNIFQLPVSKAEYEAAAKYTYDTIEELVADGWIVD